MDETLLALTVLFAVSLTQERGISIRKWLERRHPAVQFAVTFAAVFIILVNLMGGYVPIGYVYENI